MSEGFLSRWSRRKRGLEPEAPEPEAAPAATPAPHAQPTPVVPEPEEEFDLSALPPVESLGAGSDLSAFLHAKVPAALRQAAMRRVWAADPGIRDFIGPADYAWDYNAPDGVPGFSLGLGDVDVKKLLAQAIGEPEKPEPEAADPSSGEEQPEAAASEAIAAAEPPLAEESVRLTEAASQLISEEAPEPEPQPREEEQPAPTPPRRHGGAMPRLT